MLRGNHHEAVVSRQNLPHAIPTSINVKVERENCLNFHSKYPLRLIWLSSLISSHFKATHFINNLWKQIIRNRATWLPISSHREGMYVYRPRAEAGVLEHPFLIAPHGDTILYEKIIFDNVEIHGWNWVRRTLLARFRLGRTYWRRLEWSLSA